MARGWRVVFEDEFPRASLGVLACAVIITGAFGWAVLFAGPAEDEMIAHGARAVASATTYIEKESATRDLRYQRISHYADLRWQDRRGQPRSYGHLFIGQVAYDAVGPSHSGPIEILYAEDDPDRRPVVMADIPHRREEKGAAWDGLALGAIVVLFALVFFRRGLREWRAAERSKTDPPPAPW